VAHDLHHAAPVVGLRCIADAVNHVHNCIHSRIIANRIVRTGNIVINRTGERHARDAGQGEITRPAERAVAADDDDAVQPDFLTHIDRLIDALLRFKLRAAGRVEHGAAAVNNIGNAAEIHLKHIPADQSAVTAAYAKHPEAILTARTYNRTDCSIHAWRVAAAC